MRFVPGIPAQACMHSMDVGVIHLHTRIVATADDHDAHCFVAGELGHALAAKVIEAAVLIHLRSGTWSRGRGGVQAFGERMLFLGAVKDLTRIFGIVIRVVGLAGCDVMQALSGPIAPIISIPVDEWDSEFAPSHEVAVRHICYKTANYQVAAIVASLAFGHERPKYRF